MLYEVLYCLYIMDKHFKNETYLTKKDTEQFQIFM